MNTIILGLWLLATGGCSPLQTDSFQCAVQQETVVEFIPTETRCY